MAPKAALAQFAIPATIDAPTALQLSQTGKTTLIDIRRPDEWRATGVPKGARRINMLHPQGVPGFVADVLASVNGDKAAPITLICRTGNRTAQMQAVLKANGFANVSHVGEGVAGSPGQGPGWAARGLPLEAGP
jgi:rhodanese-related sulfurtransferase